MRAVSKLAIEFGAGGSLLPVQFIAPYPWRILMSMRKLVSLAFSILLLTALGFGQSAATGDLHVTVRDPKGSLVTNATVTASDPAKAFERAVTGSPDGEYSIVNLPPDTYAVVVEAPGFAKASANSVTITVGGLAELPVTLSIAAGKEVVEVSSEAELVETTRSSTTDTSISAASTISHQWPQLH